MIKNLEFFGCSVTAGNELWEEAHIPNYKSFSFDDARKVSKTLQYDEVRAYNTANSFPRLVSKQLGVPANNHGIPGISNKEIASRAIAYFTEDHYEEGTVAILQFTTHNRMFLRYKETDTESMTGSFVVHHQATDDRLSKSQNNLLKEMYFEFFNETLLAHDDHIFMYYAAEALRDKGIKVFIIWPSIQILDWGNWDDQNNCVDTKKEITIKNDVEPQYSTEISKYLAKKHAEYNPFTKSLIDIAGPDAHLPRYHFSQDGHVSIANALVEKLKNV